MTFDRNHFTSAPIVIEELAWQEARRAGLGEAEHLALGHLAYIESQTVRRVPRT